jgi:hypothetical protein
MLVLAPAASAATARIDVTYRLTTPSGTSQVVAHGVADGSARRAKAEVETPGRLLHLLFDARKGIAVYVSGTAIEAHTKGRPWLLSHNVEVLPLGDPTVALAMRVSGTARTVTLTRSEAARVVPSASGPVRARVTTDAAGRIVRFVVHAQVNGALMTMDERLSAFGTPAEVQLPSARLVFDSTVDTAKSDLSRFALAVRSYGADHHGRFTGMTRAALRRYDSKLDANVKIGRVTARTFCVDMRKHGVWVRLSGRASGDPVVAAGRC